MHRPVQPGLPGSGDDPDARLVSLVAQLLGLESDATVDQIIDELVIKANAFMTDLKNALTTQGPIDIALTINYFGISAEFDQLDFDVGYTFEIDRYLRDWTIFQTLTYEDKDRHVNIVDAKLAYRFLPKTSFLFESFLGFTDYQSKLSSDSWYTENMLGLRGELDKDFTIDLLGGFRYQKYKESRLTVDDDFSSFVARGDIDYAITDNDIISLGLERSIYESTYKNMNYYNVNFVSLNYNHRFKKKITGTRFGVYQYNCYPSETTEGGKTGKRYDHLFGGGGWLRYDMRKWISLEARYEYQQRDSRFPIFDFKDHLLSLRGTVGF